MEETKIPCPQCQADIIIKVQLLLQGQSFTCSNETCRAIISVSPGQNKGVVNTFEKLQKIKDKP